jgi:NADPH-dependent curcumin reductase CurA
VLMMVRENCRIVLCGAISSYNENPNEAYQIKNYQRLIIKRGTMRGFLYFDYKDRFKVAIKDLMSQVRVNKL